MFLKFVRKYWHLCLLTSIMVIAETVVDLWQPTLMSDVIDEGVLTGNLSIIWSLGLKMIIIVLLGGVTGILGSIFGNMAGQSVGYDLRQEVFAKMMHLPLGNAQEFTPGSLINRLSGDITQVQDAVKVAFRGIARYAFMFLGGIWMLYTLKPVFALVALCALPFLVFFVIFFLSKSSRMFGAVQKNLDGVSNVLQEDIKGERVVKAYVKETHEISRFEKANELMFNSSYRVQAFLAFLAPCMNIVLNLAIAAVILISGIDSVNAGSVTPGEIMAAITYFAIILTGASVLGNLSQTFIKAGASWKRIYEVLETPSETDEGSETVTASAGCIEFSNVSYTYPGSKVPSLSNVSFRLSTGQTLGIIGPTGSGKTTLAGLIPRLMTPDSGKIIIDGIDSREFKLSSLRSRLSYVLQKGEIYSRSVKDNIAFATGETSDEEIARVAEIARARDFIEAMPEGYETVISESGHSISGGQKQRISIARALLKPAEILIMDDCTSALDLKTEAEVMNGISEAYPGLTRIIIAGRIASVMNCDLILVLDDGKAAGLGTHDELLSSCPLYNEIYNSQLKGGESLGQE